MSCKGTPVEPSRSESIMSPPLGNPKLNFFSIYDKSALYDAVLRVYTKPLFSWQKALLMSHDGRTLYDFARHTSRNVQRLHSTLLRQEFQFREGIELHYTFNRKRRTIYLFPWEERIVDQLLFQMLNRFFHCVLSRHSYAYRYRGFGVDDCQHRITKSLQKCQRPIYLIKRDVANYYPSVDHDILLKLLEQWVEAKDYLYGLLQERVKFRILTNAGIRMADRGIPFGTPIACLLANLYLAPLDWEMAAVPDLAYYRYADDILAFSRCRDAVLEGAARLDATLAQLKLRSKASHEKNLMFAADGTADEVFKSVCKFRHLGLEFRSDGSVGLSREKARKIRNLFRFAFRRAQRKLGALGGPEQRAALLIDIAKYVVERGIRSVAIIDYYLKHVDDEKQLKLIDRWLAEEVLARALQTGHCKGNFLKLPFKRLREMGLPSLRHRRRLLRHGRLHSSFFVLRTNWLIEKERRRREKRMEKERRQLPGLRTFSPRLKAAANATS